MTSFNDLLTENIGKSFARQLALADLIGELNWSVEIQSGVCRFGNSLCFPIQLLGTEAYGDSTWLWAWANKGSNLPPNLLRSCNSLKELGEREQIAELSERSFSLDVAQGHAIALVASGLNGNCCYYRGPYDGGATFFLLTDVPADLLRPAKIERVFTVITEVISQFEVDHKVMAQAFLKSQEFEVTSATNEILATRDSDAITISLDDIGRISGIECTLKPAVQKKKWWQFWKA